jgi:fumarylacetoacetase
MRGLELDPADPFGIRNLPYCVVELQGVRCVGVRIGNQVLNLGQVEEAGLVDAAGAFVRATTLNAFLAAGRATWTRVRRRVTDLLTADGGRAAQPFLHPLVAGSERMPFDVADYVDFYSSEHHATDAAAILRPDQPALPPNWKHMPIGYHGRAGTIVVSGTDVFRPAGQRRPADAATNRTATAATATAVFGPSTRLDMEAEVGFVVGVGSSRGTGVSTDDFREHVFGVVLVNDWSARDIQAWEQQPLGPFLGKSFATSISPWVVPLDALQAAKVPAPPQDPPVAAYLVERERYTYDLTLEVRWNGTLVSRPPFRTHYWTPAQQLAHLTINGTGLRTGDLYASGTVSGPERNQAGSLLELTWGGTQPVRLDDGSSRTFLLDGDILTITGIAPGPDATIIGLGEVAGIVRPPPWPQA